MESGELGEIRVWKLFGLVPIMLIHNQEVVQIAATQRRVNTEGRPTSEGSEREGPQEQLPQEVMEFVPTAEVSLSAKLFATCLREATSGSSPGPGGCNKMLKVCLDNTEASHLLTSAAEDFARSSVPDCIFQAFTMATMTALCNQHRRLEPKTLAKQFMVDVEQVCAPFSSLSPLVRRRIVWDTPCEQSPIVTVFSIDGTGGL